MTRRGWIGRMVAWVTGSAVVAARMDAAEAMSQVQMRLLRSYTIPGPSGPSDKFLACPQAVGAPGVEGPPGLLDDQVLHIERIPPLSAEAWNEAVSSGGYVRVRTMPYAEYRKLFVRDYNILTPPPERARSFVQPSCPRCGNAVLFSRRSQFVGDLIPVNCGGCGWTGVSPHAR